MRSKIARKTLSKEQSTVDKSKEAEMKRRYKRDYIKNISIAFTLFFP